MLIYYERKTLSVARKVWQILTDKFKQACGNFFIWREKKTVKVAAARIGSHTQDQSILPNPDFLQLQKD